jgi:phosphoglycerate dehydrogenase-like enzyme
METMRPRLRLLNEQTVLILGFGTIARRLVELARPLEMNLIAVRRVVKDDEKIRVVPTAAVEEWLPLTDHLVNILPANDGTRHFVNAERLARLKSGAMFYNIGRGTTVDQEALLAALQSGRLGGAYLDVTEPEPLPPEHPLWTAPRCLITPHIAGGFSVEKEQQVRHFLENLRRFEKGEALLDRIW